MTLKEVIDYEVVWQDKFSDDNKLKVKEVVEALRSRLKNIALKAKAKAL